MGPESVPDRASAGIDGAAGFQVAMVGRRMELRTLFAVGHPPLQG
jgi:hypothetical protein